MRWAARSTLPILVFLLITAFSANAQVTDGVESGLTPVVPAPPPNSATAPELAPCEPGAHVNITAMIISARPPSENGYPWTLELLDPQGECALRLIQTDAKPPAACEVEATVSASGKVFDQTLINPGDLRCSPKGQPHQTAGWFDWLWGSTKPAAEPPPPASVTAASPPTAPAAPSAPTATDGPTTTVTYLGQSITLVAPPGMCFVPADSAVLKLIVERVLIRNQGFPAKVLAGYRECDLTGDSIRALIGVYFAPDLPDAHYADDAKKRELLALPSEFCRDAFAATYVSSGGFDDQVPGKIDEAARKVLGDPSLVTADAAMLGVRGRACNFVGVWAFGEGEKRRGFANFGSFFIVKDRLIVFSDSSFYAGGAAAKHAYDRIMGMMQRVEALNGGN